MNDNWKLFWFSTSPWKCGTIGFKLWRSWNINENSENIQHVVIICFHQEQTSFKWMEETVSLMGLSSLQNINWFKFRMKGKCWRVLLFGFIISCGRDDRWFNCWRLWLNEMLCELFENNGIDLGNESFSDDVFVTQWCERESSGERKKWIFLGLVLNGGGGLPVGTTGHPLVLQ